MTLTTAISVPAPIVNGDASMGRQLAQKWCSDCHAVGAEDAEAYGSMPSFVLIAEKCFSIGGLNWYSRRSTVPGLRRGKQELAAGTLTPSILVRIQVPQPSIPVFSGVSPLARKSATLAGVRRQDGDLARFQFHDPVGVGHRAIQ